MFPTDKQHCKPWQKLKFAVFAQNQQIAKMINPLTAKNFFEMTVFRLRQF